MISRYTIEATSQRLIETEQAIAEQRRYLESLSDPALKTIAQRTLSTLEDMLLIMQRTQGLLAGLDRTPRGDERR
jgi:hypothetical protein